MSTIKFKRFTKPHFLKQIGRGLLGQFFNRFNTALGEKQIVLPAATLDDDAYFGAVAKIAMSPEGLPGTLVDAAHEIEDMANDDGQDRLERATGENGLAFHFRDDSSCAEISMQAWLDDPEVFAEKFNEQRLARLASFDYFGSKVPVDHTDTFVPPTAQTVELMTADMEEAFRQKNRGQHTTQIEVHEMDGEHWFLIRHGDTYSRVPTVADGQMSVLHFRPAKYDVAVYSPQRDEIRVHAGTKWEKALYQETFGRRLFGDDWYFSERKAYTLDPLRADGVDALGVSDVPGITRIVLREIEIAWAGEFGDSMIRKSTDIFMSAAARNMVAVPEHGRLVRAAFDVYFGDSQKPRKIQLRPPNILKLGRHCDAALVQRWLNQRGFRAASRPDQGGNATNGQHPNTPSGGPRGGITHVEPLALS
jgi:hypothetical protein